MALGLTILAIVQLVLLGARVRALGPAPDFLTSGDDVSMMSVGLGNGTVVSLGDGRRTLLLVFDPDCPHTQRVARAWAEWLSAVDAGDLRILAIAPGSHGPAAAYASEMGWRVPVVTVAGLDDETVQMITGRVPWVIAINEEGVVASEDPGSKIAEVAEALWGGGD